jgi:hypothetical protein
VKIKYFPSESFSMSYLISADVKGIKYYVKIEQWAFHGKIISYSHQGLKNNATKFETKGLAEEVAKALSEKSPWELKVEEA